MNILITGVHGFVGSNLIIALKEHYTLYGLDIIAPEKEGVIKTFCWKDIETTSFPVQKLPHFDAIIHLDNIAPVVPFIAVFWYRNLSC